MNPETGEEFFHTFTYNADGLRIQRTCYENGRVYNYVYDGSLLTQMSVDGNVLRFTYDANGTPLTVIYEDITYYYVVNLQGDIVAILDSTGTKIVSYTYDAWGNILSVTGSMAQTLGSLNPLRYRGYVYDVETGLYYLQSRYYNPEWGRFISADDVDFLGADGTIASYNLFAYCSNNPVIYQDSTGYAIDTIWDIVSLAVSIIDVCVNPTDPWSWVGLVGDVIDLIPFVTGVGEVTRIAKVTGKIADGYGDLSKAQQYGVKSYNVLKKTLKGTGLDAHHVVEQRLVKHLNIDVKTMLSVAVTKAEHQRFTNAWRKAFQYGMNYNALKPEDIWNAAQKIYKDYPKILEATHKTLFD